MFWQTITLSSVLQPTKYLMVTSPTASTNDMVNDKTASTTFFTTYSFFWCWHILIPFFETKLIAEGHGAYDIRPIHALDLAVLYPLVGTLLYLCCCTKSPLTMEVAVATHFIDLSIKFYRMPALWDHEHWGMLTHLSFVVAFLVCQRSSIVDMERCFLKAVQLQFAMLYAAAAFWKLNTSFFHHEFSCGSLLLLELVGSYVYIDFSPEALVLMAKAAPTVTFVGEASISGFMMHFASSTAANRKSRDIAVFLAMFFHTTIIMLPMNSAGGFTLACMSRLICFFDSAELDALYTKLNQQTTFCHRTFAAAFLVATSVPLLRLYMVGLPPDVGTVSNSLLCVFYTVLIGAQVPVPNATTIEIPSPTLVQKIGLVVTLLVTFVYSFVTPILGVQQMGASTMYGNVRNYGPSNHYLVPTGVLPNDILFGGGLVRVISSTSDSLNLQFGHVRSEEVFPEGVRELASIGRDGPAIPSNYPLQLFPYVMTSHHSRGQIMPSFHRSQDFFQQDGTFLQYVLPISRLREAIFESVANDEVFLVTVCDAGIDSKGLANELSRIIQIGTNFSCLLVDSEQECSSDPLGKRILDHQDFLLNRLVRKLLLPYPSLVGLEEEICIT